MAEIAQFATSADRLDPAKDFLDPLAPALAVAVARMPGGAAVDGAAPAAVVLGDPRSSRGQAVRGHAQAARIPDEVARVIGAVRAHGLRSADAALQLLKRRSLPGPDVGLGQLDVDDQTVPVLGQRVTEVAELRALLLALALEPRLGIGGRDVRLTSAALASEVPITVAPRAPLP